jgi:hypothetical protein
VAYLRELGAEETTGSPVALEVLDRLEMQSNQILEGQRRAERRWKWQTVAAIAGAVFAAVRLGIIAVPHVKAYTSNPPRRRRRRRS